MKSLAIILVLFVTSAHAAPDSARQFVTDIYKHYPVDPAHPYNPTHENAPRIFTSGLVALIRHDEIQLPGDQGNLNVDPFCDCQDDSGMKLLSINQISRSAAKAVFNVHLQFMLSRNRVTLFLVQTPAGWRVDDIGYDKTASLRKILAQ